MDREEELRERLVLQMQRTHALRTPNVTAAFLSVFRHRFIPNQPIELAYEDRALALKEQDGSVISSISQPGMIAQMLEMLDVHPGDRIFEIGTGSGYNAALLSSLVGPTGSVVTIELEPDLAESAGTRLQELGYTNVEVRTGDAEHIALEEQFDGIIVTARTNDIAGVWWDALKDGGHIVVPLDIAYGGERVVAFVRQGLRLASIGTQACSFIGMRNHHESTSSEIFFRNPGMRYAPQPDARVPIAIVARRRDDVRADFLENADVVVARPETFFGITLHS
jgi:protein-L-isoaspartate(D-aspartate) O-methyltransferase